MALKKSMFWAVIALLFITPVHSGSAKPAISLIQVSPNVCQQGQDLYYGPEKDFAVYVFCDDALGTTIGIINTKPAFYTKPGSEKVWSLENRFWQDSRWCRDVVSFMWSGDNLIVETSGIYGTGKIYTLDLHNRAILQEVTAPMKPE